MPKQLFDQRKNWAGCARELNAFKYANHALMKISVSIEPLKVQFSPAEELRI